MVNTRITLRIFVDILFKRNNCFLFFNLSLSLCLSLLLSFSVCMCVRLAGAVFEKEERKNEVEKGERIEMGQAGFIWEIAF